MRLILISAFFYFLAGACFAQKFPTANLYLGQTPPENTPKALPLFVNKGFFAAERIAISNDGRDIYYSEIKGYYPIRGENIKRYIFADGKWTGPFDMFVGYAPSLSLTGDTMYLERKGPGNKSETYISVRSGSVWANPKRILTKLDKAHYYQVTKTGNHYISSIAENGTGLNDWCKVVITGADTSASSLGRPLNTGGENLDFFVSKDESYMIVTNRPGLSISYRKNDGSWTNPRNLGKKIDFGLGSWGPYVSPDNKYLFYSTGTKPDYSDVGVFWVRIDGVIDSLKNTNLSPYIKSLIKDQTAVARQPFTFTVPDNIFFDDDSNVALTYSATLLNGNPLPSWISFDQRIRTFSGTPGETGELIIKVVVADSSRATAFCPVKIIITANPVKSKNSNIILFDNPPDSVPVVFGKGIISVEDRYEYGLAISPDYREIYFTAEAPAKGLSVMKRSENGNWTYPETADLRGNNSWEFEAFYNNDGSKLFFSSDVNDTSRLWFISKSETGWGSPVLLESPVNSTPVFWATITRNNTLYYTNLANFQIYKSRLTDGRYRTTEKGGLTFGIHPFISPAEDFILFNGKGDIYISFAKGDEWTEPVRLGNQINSIEFDETCPSLSPDGKYIFFSRYNDKNGKSDIYWVNSNIIEKTRKKVLE